MEEVNLGGTREMRSRPVPIRVGVLRTGRVAGSGVWECRVRLRFWKWLWSGCGHGTKGRPLGRGRPSTEALLGSALRHDPDLLFPDICFLNPVRFQITLI